MDPAGITWEKRKINPDSMNGEIIPWATMILEAVFTDRINPRGENNPGQHCSHDSMSDAFENTISV